MINGHAVNYYTTQQAAEILGMTGSNVLLLLKAGKLRDVSTGTSERSPKRVDVSSVHAHAELRRAHADRNAARKEAAQARKASRERLKNLLTRPSVFEKVATAPPVDALMQQHIAQTQQVIDLLTKLVGVWCPAGTRQ